MPPDTSQMAGMATSTPVACAMPGRSPVAKPTSTGSAAAAIAKWRDHCHASPGEPAIDENVAGAAPESSQDSPRQGRRTWLAQIAGDEQRGQHRGGALARGRDGPDVGPACKQSAEESRRDLGRDGGSRAREQRRRPQVSAVVRPRGEDVCSLLNSDGQPCCVRSPARLRCRCPRLPLCRTGDMCGRSNHVNQGPVRELPTDRVGPCPVPHACPPMNPRSCWHSRTMQQPQARRGRAPSAGRRTARPTFNAAGRSTGLDLCSGAPSTAAGSFRGGRSHPTRPGIGGRCPRDERDRPADRSDKSYCQRLDGCDAEGAAR